MRKVRFDEHRKGFLQFRGADGRLVGIRCVMPDGYVPHGDLSHGNMSALADDGVVSVIKLPLKRTVGWPEKVGWECWGVCFWY